MGDNSSLNQAQHVMCIVTPIICMITVSFVLIKVNKRIPTSFFISILLYTLGIMSRAANELLFELKNTDRSRIITTSFCFILIEFSLAYFIF